MYPPTLEVDIASIAREEVELSGFTSFFKL